MGTEVNESDRRLSILGYRVNNIEMALACNHPNGVVLSLGEKRVELNKAQFLCLYDMLSEFLHHETEL